VRRTVLLLSAIAIMSIAASGTAMADVITGTENHDALTGTEAADSITGLGADDFLLGEPTLFGPGSDDFISGGSGDDKAYGNVGDDFVSGGPGDDDIAGTVGHDRVYGDDGDDKVSGGYPFDPLSDAIFGGAGDDIMDAYNSPAVADTVDCGPGNDLVYRDAADTIFIDCEASILGPEPDPDDLQFLT
jgi:Ca2+-binding RTX toxin-like protein